MEAHGGRKRIKVWRGRVGREELQSILREADVTVVPSLCYENSPTVIFESFAFGVPVLASAIEGVSELIQDGKNGLTFTAGNAEGLAGGLKWFVEHRRQWPEMSVAAEVSLKGLDLASYLDKLVNLCYSEALLV
ncbi:MAG: Glycosyl transferase group 1 [Candidatus Magasanikbacteria bacterium GW2011_GWC2_45_8]|uniref:Glycosyl transferase group 1 n=1 Tax=Candidatus Magasanikbacteria bacterium GW2011_GWC2_45_8 TaxID=1619050 RepID=A0A0G1N0W7_9BACT|nr:MAG: Glycosyl transferase group 1 [Candidatus Magasanikbacteria bacterium GW2011_GWC2_45_8]